METVSRRSGEKNCFYIFREGEEDGPFSLEELEEMQRNGKVSAATPCRNRRDREWHDLAFVLRVSLEQEEVLPVVERAELEAGGSGRAVPRGSSAGIREMEGEGVALQMAELIQVTREQNRLLSSIRGALICMLLAGLGAGVLLWFLR